MSDTLQWGGEAEEKARESLKRKEIRPDARSIERLPAKDQKSRNEGTNMASAMGWGEDEHDRFPVRQSVPNA